MTGFPSIRIEGGLFAPDILDQLMAGDLPGQEPSDFGIEERRSLTDEIAGIFADARQQWEIFRRQLARLSEEDKATKETRNLWVIPFLSLLGYELTYNTRAYEVEGVQFAISHRAGINEEAPPVHIVGARQELGRLDPKSRPRMAPHVLLQEFLNRTEHLWGIVTNGRTLRLLRDSTYIRRQAYVEFDLEGLFEEQRFQDFVVLYRLLHRTRLPVGVGDARACLLEQYYQLGLEQGGRVRERLREGVEACLQHLANGFLAHPANTELRIRIAGASPQFSPEDFYRQLLRLVYRFLFLLVSEERGLISGEPLYQGHYGVGRLRRLASQRSAYTEHEDLWCSLRVLWKVLSDEKLAPLLGAAPLNGELFAPMELDRYSLTNRDLLQAFWHLSYYRESRSAAPRRINYAALDVEELGSVYESLLDYRPHIDHSGGVPRFELASGSERKATGSYYTPAELVAELIHSALEPVIEERLRGASTPEQKAQAILSIRVLDPACGSGHFLLAAARRLGKALAKARQPDTEPAPEALRHAIREVVAHCIYGVDKNPLAVELCRVALWLESHAQGMPLSFLDHRIRCGDSLVGLLDLFPLHTGIPDAAFDPVANDDKIVAKSLRHRNHHERHKQLEIFTQPLDPQSLHTLLTRDAKEVLALEQIPDDSISDIAQKKRRFEALQRQQAPYRQAAHIWTAAFFQPMNKEALDNNKALTTALVWKALLHPLDPQPTAVARTLAERLHFFHWYLEFPEAFLHGGFDVILCNPPWERIKLQEEEFFSARAPEITRASNKAERARLIHALPTTNPALWQAYQDALHDAEALSKFLRRSGRFPLTAHGDINTYSVFAELILHLLHPKGRAGVVLPTGIATDANNQRFFAHLIDSGRLISLFDFENREGVFAGVHRSYKFSLVTLGGAEAKREMEFAFFLTRAEALQDPQRRFTLRAADFALLNPNTRTCPIFRTRQDAELTKAIYQRVPVLVNEHTNENPWGVHFLAMFHMSNDSHLFRTRADLEKAGYRLVGNRFVRGEETYLPLYEAKMIWHYDHRFGTYEGVRDRSSTHLPTPDERQHADPAFVVLPWYWVPAEEVEARLTEWKRGWLLGFRDVCRSTDERTAIFSLMPRVGVGNKIPLLLFEKIPATKLSAFLANASSIVLDFVVRQKLGGMTMNFFYVKQFPVLPPSTYTPEDLLFIVPRVLELIYTSWDVGAFAADVWEEADEGLRVALRAQWEANRKATGGVGLEPPAWAEGVRVPFPPFRWDEQRRAELRAELDAYYARLYGLSRKQLRYILDPADLTEEELRDILDPREAVSDPLDPRGYEARAAKSTFPGETFRVLREKERRTFGEYRTRRLVLKAWENLTS